jgi:TonB family protein
MGIPAVVKRTVLVAVAALVWCGAAPGGAAAQGADGVYAPGQLTVAPTLASMDQVRRAVERSYPAVLRQSRVGGRVTLQLVVEPDGSVDKASIEVLSAAVSALGDAAKRAAADFSFKPGEVDGRAVRARVVIPITYGSQ